jgi:hypothetical protein
MSVELQYPSCLFGNRLFQYAAARLFALQNGLALKSTFRPGNEHGVVSAIPFEGGEAVSAPLVKLTDAPVFAYGGFTLLSNPDELLTRSWPRARYVLKGWFQHAHWYYERRKHIEAFYQADPIGEVNTRDIVIHLRVQDDYRAWRWIIHPTWYLKILEAERFDRLHVVTDARNQQYLSWFARYDPVIVSSTGRADWQYIRSFDRIICSNSTFCWWAAFLSRARKIYTFKRWINAPHVRMGQFPNGMAIDGPFMHEGPLQAQ